MLEQNNNQNFLKLGVTSLRKYMCEKDRSDEERTINKKEIFDLLLGHFIHSKDFSIKVFININQNIYFIKI